MAIVGGGITGALVAHAFASAGIATTLLEGSLVGRGSTAASSALLLQEPDLELMELAKRYGLATSRRIWERSRESARELVALFERLHIRCGLKKSDAVYYAVDARAVAATSARITSFVLGPDSKRIGSAPATFGG